MNLKSSLLSFAKTSMEFGQKNKPAILTGFAVFGIISTGVTAYRAGLIADEILENYRKDLKDVKHGDKEAKKAVIKDTAMELAPIVIPPILLGGVSIACVLGSHCESHKRIAALSAAYSISEKAVTDLNDKMKEMLGEKKATEIRNAVTKDKLKKDQNDKKLKGVDLEDEIINAGGNVLCMDLYSGRYFRSNANKIGRAINVLTADIQSDMYVSLNDFYDLLNIPQIPMGDDLGWSIDDTDHGRLPIHFTALLTENNQPCLCVEYDAKIRADYRNLH